ncbi:Hypothetical protein AT6N2_L2192 [Agrobacterium tumefaciens]|nr:Hypothetical protein AT6N2_L2192 [Agrobacterium tumefaciens]
MALPSFWSGLGGRTTSRAASAKWSVLGNAEKADHAVRRRRPALDLFGDGIGIGLVAEIDDRHVIVEDDACSIVFFLADRVVGRSAGLVQQLVHFGIAIFHIVDAALAGDELVQVAIGIDASRPVGAAELIIPGGLLGQKRRKFRGLEGDVEAGLRHHGLDDLHHLRLCCVVGVLKLDIQRLVTCLFHQLLGLVDVTRRHRQVLVEPWACGRISLIAGLGGAFKNDLADGFAVDRVGESLTQALVLAERIIRPRAIVDVDIHGHVSGTNHIGIGQLGVILDGFRIGSRNALGDIEIAGTKVRKLHRGIWDRQVDDPVDEDFVLVPIVSKFFEHDAILLDALDEFERSGADRLRTEIGTQFLGRFRCDDHTGAVGKLRQQGHVRRLQREFDLERSRRLNLLDRRQLALAARFRQRHVALDGGDDGGGIQRFAIVELDAVADFHGQHLAAVGPGPFGGQLRHDLHILRDIHQLVAHGGVNDAADESARLRGVEHIGIVIEADAQFGR